MTQTKELVLSVAIGQAIAERLNLHNDHGLIRTTWGKKTIQGLGEMVLDIVREENKRLEDFNTVSSVTHIIKAGQKVEFQGCPDGAYCAMGVNGSKAGDLYLMVFDNGTTLTPIFNNDGKQVYMPLSYAGMTYDKKSNTWKP